VGKGITAFAQPNQRERGRQLDRFRYGKHRGSCQSNLQLPFLLT
jgi:hypothetical protein